MELRKKSWHQQVRDLTKLYSDVVEQNKKLADEVMKYQVYFGLMKGYYDLANTVNKKNLEYFKSQLRAAQPIPEELEDK